MGLGDGSKYLDSINKISSETYSSGAVKVSSLEVLKGDASCEADLRPCFSITVPDCCNWELRQNEIIGSDGCISEDRQKAGTRLFDLSPIKGKAAGFCKIV